MFLHLGDDETVPYEDILAIIDIEKNNQQRFLADEYVKQGKTLVEIVPLRKAKSMVISENTIYLSPISSNTLARRAENEDYMEESENNV